MRIFGTGSAVPRRTVTNDELTTFLDTSDEWISTRTGIRERRVLSDDRLSDLAIEAANRALTSAGVQAGEIDLILCSTVQAEAVTPALACIIQGGIGATCPGYDINNGCAGFISALDAADAYLSCGKARRILIVCAEAMSRLCDWTDRSTCVLFGDAAGAVVVGQGEGLISIELTVASNTDVLNAYSHAGNSPFAVNPVDFAPMKMNGQEVYKFAVSQSQAGIVRCLERAGLCAEDIDHFLLHQANLRIVEGVRARFHLGKDRFPTNIDHTGNTSSATIPLLLDELNRAGSIKDGDTLILSAFGAGLSTGTCLLRWNK